MPSPPAGVSLALDGRQVGVGTLGTPIPVDAGTQTLVVTAAGYKEWTRFVAVGAREKVTVDVPPLEALPPEPAAPVSAPAPAAAASTAPVSVTRAEPRAPRWRRPTAVALMAGGAVALGAGLVFGVTARSKWDQAFDDDHCTSDNVCTERGIELTDQARSRATTATILTVSGLVLAGAGIAIWVWPAKDGGDDGVALAPAVGDRSGELVLTGRF
jgi:hypothetical protein